MSKAHGYYRAGLAAARDREIGWAIEYANRALLLDPEHENAAALLSLCLRQSTLVRAMNIEGCRLALKGEYTDAARLFANALQRDGTDGTALRCLCACLRESGKTESKKESVWRRLWRTITKRLK